MIDQLDISVDGACRGNPGPAAIGIVIRDKKEIIREIAKPIGDATNNIAEYSALVYALQYALFLKAQKVRITTDSELVFKQVSGSYKVKDETIRFLFEQVQLLASLFKKFEIKHVMREYNKEADRLASSILDKRDKLSMVASLFDNDGEESPSSKG